MTRTTTTTLEAPKASPSSPALEGDATLETFLSKQSQWLTAGAAADPPASSLLRLQER
jgi:hypothetical protein